MGKITRIIDDGDREEISKPRTAADILDDAIVIDLEKELHKTKVTSEDMRWEHTGRHLFKRKIDEIRQ